MRIKDVTKHDSNAQLLESVPRIGRFTALVISSEMDEINRFSNSHKLCAYAGIVPSVRKSTDICCKMYNNYLGVRFTQSPIIYHIIL